MPAEFAGAGYLGRGVELQTVSQSRDRFIEQQLPLAFGTQSRSSAESDSLRTISVLDPDAPLGVPTALSKFLYSLARPVPERRRSGAAPGGGGRVATAGADVQQHRQGAIESARTGIDAGLGGVVQEVNRAAARWRA